MLFTPELRWLQPLFEQRGWELLYLDPSMMEYGKKRKPSLSRWKQDWWDQYLSRDSYWRKKSIGDATFKIGQSIEQDWKRNAVNYFLDRKLMQRIIGDREIQRQAVEWLENGLQELTIRALLPSYTSVQDLRTGTVRPDESREELGSLVMVEGIIGQQPQVPQALVRGFPAITQQNREMRYFLFDRLPHFLKADDPIIGVRLDTRAFFQVSRDLERFLISGWYPYVKVVGHYSTLVGGTTFLDALAVFFRRFPPLDPLLYPLNTMATQFGFCSTFTLMQATLTKEQQEAHLLWERVRKTHDAGSNGADPERYFRDQETLRRRNSDMDERLLSPLVWLDLCCKLNGFAPSDLSTKGRAVFECLQQYALLLLNWSKELKKQGIDSVLVSNQERFLKEEITALLSVPR